MKRGAFIAASAAVAAAASVPLPAPLAVEEAASSSVVEGKILQSVTVGYFITHPMRDGRFQRYPVTYTLFSPDAECLQHATSVSNPYAESLTLREIPE